MMHHENMVHAPAEGTLRPPATMPVSTIQAERIYTLQQELDGLFAARDNKSMSLEHQERVEAIFNEIDAIYSGA